MPVLDRELLAPEEIQETKPRQTGPCVMVIFGATGDLTSRKLFPALYNLAKSNLLSREFAIVGIGRNDYSTEAFRQQMGEQLQNFATTKVEPELRDWLLRRLYYVRGEFNESGLYTRLAQALAEVDTKHNTQGNYFFYLATSPAFFGVIVDNLGAAGLAKQENGHWRRVVFEKPFGSDLDSAKALNQQVRKVLSEDQIYRIDHYLGKETVQNILVFRFSNGIFEPIWNHRYIDHVQITVEQSKILRAIQPLSAEDVLHCAVRGQYSEGEISGEHVPAYRAEQDVPPDSKTETFAALKILIDNWRWANVPFYLRTGKRLAKRHSEVSIQFKRAPFVLFRDTPVCSLKPNQLVIHIAPDEGISLRFGAKIPGAQMRVGSVEMDFNYADYFGVNPNTGYEVLLYDGIMGDQTLFQRADMVEAGWAAVNPVLDVWKALPPRNFPNYPAGSWGPVEADELITRDGRHWRKISDEHLATNVRE